MKVMGVLQIKRIILNVLVSFGALLISHDELSAHGINLNEMQSKQLEPVIVIGRSGDMVGIADSAAQGYVGQTELGKRPILRAGEVMELVPGMVATQHSGTGKSNQYFLRGFNLDHGTDFSASLDGVPINLPTHGHGQGYLDLNFIIPELIDHLEYKKGPYYTEIGDFSSAGAAEIRYVDKLDRGFVKLGFGENGFARAVAADSVTWGDSTFLYGVEAHHYDGPWVNKENMKKFNSLLKYTTQKDGRKFSVSALAYRNEWDSSDQVPLRAVNSGQIDRLGTIDDTVGGETERFGLSANYITPMGNGETSVLGYLYYYSLNLWSNFTFFQDDAVNGDQFEQEDRRIVTGGEVKHYWDGLLADFDTSHTAGLELRHDYIPDVALFKTKNRSRLSTVRDDKVNQTSVGLYYKNEIHWMEKFRSTAGIRGDIYSFDVNSSLAVNSGNETDSIISPKLGLIFGPWAETEFYVNGGYGFHSNDARGTTITVDPQTSLATSSVDPLVRSKGAEIGVRSSFVLDLRSTLSLWYLELDSELLFVGDAGTTEASRPSRRYGVEWSNFYQVNKWLKFDLDAAITHARFTDYDSAGDYIPGAPNLVLSSGAVVDLENGAFGSLRVRHFGKRPLIEDNSVKSDTTTIWNFQAGYRVRDNITATLDILNIFDSDDHDIDYYYSSKLASEGSSVDDIHFHPVEPRTIRAYITIYF